jgi:hypothetical protein
MELTVPKPQNPKTPKPRLIRKERQNCKFNIINHCVFR